MRVSMFRHLYLAILFVFADPSLAQQQQPPSSPQRIGKDTCKDVCERRYAFDFPAADEVKLKLKMCFAAGHCRISSPGGAIVHQPQPDTTRDIIERAMGGGQAPSVRQDSSPERQLAPIDSGTAIHPNR
jgi:hypothetical protein